MTMRGRTQTLRLLCAFRMKYASIFSVYSKSAMTPSFIGLIATMLPGVRPSISLASRPTASTRPLTLLMAMIDGSLTTMPLPRTYTQVLAVPRSMARSLENRENRERNAKIRGLLPPESRDGRPIIQSAATSMPFLPDPFTLYMARSAA